MNKKINNKQGFTLIELVVVMIIIGILVLLAAPRFLRYIEKARYTNIINDTRATETVALPSMVKNHMKLPEGTKVDEKADLIEEIRERRTYGKDGLILMGDEEFNPDVGRLSEIRGEETLGRFYKLDKKDYVRPETRTRLKGEFYIAYDGTVIYVSEEGKTASGQEGEKTEYRIKLKHILEDEEGKKREIKETDEKMIGISKKVSMSRHTIDANFDNSIKELEEENNYLYEGMGLSLESMTNTSLQVDRLSEDQLNTIYIGYKEVPTKIELDIKHIDSSSKTILVEESKTIDLYKDKNLSKEDFSKEIGKILASEINGSEYEYVGMSLAADNITEDRQEISFDDLDLENRNQIYLGYKKTHNNYKDLEIKHITTNTGDVFYSEKKDIRLEADGLLSGSSEFLTEEIEKIEKENITLEFKGLSLEGIVYSDEIDLESDDFKNEIYLHYKDGKEVEINYIHILGQDEKVQTINKEMTSGDKINSNREDMDSDLKEEMLKIEGRIRKDEKPYIYKYEGMTLDKENTENVGKDIDVSDLRYDDSGECNVYLIYDREDRSMDEYNILTYKDLDQELEVYKYRYKVSQIDETPIEETMPIEEKIEKILESRKYELLGFTEEVGRLDKVNEIGRYRLLDENGEPYLVEDSCLKINNIGEYAFYLEDKSKEVKVESIDFTGQEDNLVEIGKFAFTRNAITGELDLSILTSLEEIGRDAFNNNLIEGLNLKGLDSLAKIGEFAFKSNKISGTLDISDLSKLETISWCVFQSNSIKSVKWGEKNKALKKIESVAFSNNRIEGTLDFNVLENLENIDSSAFSNNLIEGVRFGEKNTKLTKIGINAFADNRIGGNFSDIGIDKLTSLKSLSGFKGHNFEEKIVIPDLDSLEEIGGNAFAREYNYNNKIEFEFPKLKNLKHIRGDAFRNAVKGEVDLSPLKSLESIGPYAFANNEISGIEFGNLVDKDIKLWKGVFSRSLKYDTLKLSEFPLKGEIPDELFKGNSQVKKVEFNKEQNIQKIGNEAFRDCAITELDFSKTPLLEEIGRAAFESCDIRELDFSKNDLLKKIGNMSFYKNILGPELDLRSLPIVAQVDSFAFGYDEYSTKPEEVVVSVYLGDHDCGNPKCEHLKRAFSYGSSDKDFIYDGPGHYRRDGKDSEWTGPHPIEDESIMEETNTRNQLTKDIEKEGETLELESDEAFFKKLSRSLKSFFNIN